MAKRTRRMGRARSRHTAARRARMVAKPPRGMPRAVPALCSPPMSDRTAPSGSLLWTMLAPGLFVVLWSTGFIFAKMGLPYAEPFTFVALRYLVVVAIMLPVALILRAT